MTARTAPVVLDVMGGDAAPDVAIEAAETLRRRGTPVLLCGHPDVVGPDGLHAEDVVGMAEEPAFAVHQRRDVSIRVAARAVADGRASAVVSAGSTGATVAAALLELGRQPGVRRPVIAARVPTEGGCVLLLDVGALPDADAAALVTAAELGCAHVRREGNHRPTVGLLNVGTEAGKGDALRREVAVQLADVDGFAGNVEPHDLLAGAVDVVVTDGFTGNLVLKTIEAMLASTGPAAGTTTGVRPRDGAAVLLGVAGTVLVAHGAATADDLVAAVHRAGALVACARTSDAVLAEGER